LGGAGLPKFVPFWGVDRCHSPERRILNRIPTEILPAASPLSPEVSVRSPKPAARPQSLLHFVLNEAHSCTHRCRVYATRHFRSLTLGWCLMVGPPPVENLRMKSDQTQEPQIQPETGPASVGTPRCADCGEPVELAETEDPDSWIHAADANYFGDHTAWVSEA